MKKTQNNILQMQLDKGRNWFYANFLKNLSHHFCIINFDEIEYSDLYHEKLQIVYANIRV